MPIHLAPISRRRFLQRSLVAGAGLALAPRLLATEKSIDENSWALFSDPHLAADRALVFRSVNMTQHFQKVSTELLALPSLPAGLFVNGDCAYSSGEKGDYSLLAELLRPLREQQIHVHLALGNHDNRERFWDALEEEKTAKRPLADRQVALV